ncbi:hypothetical protein BGZ72_005380 [Mortierella alpina]|nr:hypothetical protein BGZ72_005380 [Mortierella alpina]
MTLVLVTLASWTLFCHAAPAGLLPRQDHELIESISPKEGSTYNVGDTILAQVNVIDEELSDDTEIKLTLQRAIPKPDVNVPVAVVALSDLSEKGYKFVVKAEHQGDPERTNRYRIRYSFYDNDGEHHYVDSGVFKIFPEEP